MTVTPQEAERRSRPMDPRPDCRRRHRRRRHLRHRRGLPHHRAQPAADLHHPGTARADRRHLGFVPLPRRALRQQHLHAELSVRAVDPGGRRRRRRAHPRIPGRHRAQVRHRPPHPVQQPRALARTGIRPPTPGRSPCEQDGGRRHYRSRFVFFGSGYYNYDEGYTPDFPGIERFGGTVVHPQHWPEDLDYTGKKVVVIGSGATAMTLIPALAERAGKVTMLQRSPTYLISASKYGTFAVVSRKVLPRRAAHLIIRMNSALMEGVLWFLSRKTPAVIKWLLRRKAVQNLPDGYDIDTHFKPPLQPVGPAAVPDSRRRPVHCDHRGPRRGGHRPHRPLRRHRYRAASPGSTWTPTSSSPPPACSCRRSAAPRSAWTASRSTPRTASSTRRTCSKTCRTCSGVWAIPTRRGRCGPTSPHGRRPS